MSDLPKLFYLVNNGTELAAYKVTGNAPWFIIEAKKCEGDTPEKKHAEFAEAVKFIRTALGPLADYRELRTPTLPGIKI